MKHRMLMLFGLGLLVSGSGAQWFETTVPADSWPFALCHNPQDDYVYCANWGGGNVTVIDGATNVVVTTVTTGAQARAVIYGPTNNKVFCLNEEARNLSVIDGATNAVVATESLATRPWDGVRCPVNDRLYVIGRNPNRVVVVNCQTYAVETSITLAQGPYGICYDSTDNRVYVATRADSSVHVLDCVANSIIATVKVGPAPNRLCWNSRENRVYTATAEPLDSTVSVIDCASNTVVASLKPGRWPHRVTYDPVRSRVYVSCFSDNRVAVIDGATNGLVATVPVPGSPEGGCAAPDLGCLFVAVLSDTVLAFDVATAAIAARVGVGRGPTSLVYNPTDNRVYTTDFYGATVSILRASGGVVEPEGGTAMARRRGATLVRGVLHLRPSPFPLPEGEGRGAGHVRNPPGDFGSCPKPELIDASGRKVTELRPGPNDVRHLAPGVYLICGEDSGRRVVVVE